MSTYTLLQYERENIAEKYRQYDSLRRMGLYYPPYMNEIKYTQIGIEKKMIPHEIVNRMKLYYHLNNKIPVELIIHIASFGYIADTVAAKFFEEGKPATLEAVDPS